MKTPTFEQLLKLHNNSLGVCIFHGVFPVKVFGKPVDAENKGYREILTTVSGYSVDAYYAKTGTMPAKPYYKTILGREPKTFETWESENTFLYKITSNHNWKVTIVRVDNPIVLPHLHLGCFIHYNDKNTDWMPVVAIHQLGSW